MFVIVDFVFPFQVLFLSSGIESAESGFIPNNFGFFADDFITGQFYYHVRSLLAQFFKFYDGVSQELGTSQVRFDPFVMMGGQNPFYNWESTIFWYFFSLLHIFEIFMGTPRRKRFKIYMFKIHDWGTTRHHLCGQFEVN